MAPDPRVDAAVQRAFRDSGLDPDRLTNRPKPGPPTPLRSYTGAGLVLTVAVEPAGIDRILVETAGRSWAQAHGVPVPEVTAMDPAGSWFVAELLETTTPAGADYVAAALEVADRIAASPPPQLPVPAATWRASRRTALARLTWLVRGGMPLRRFLTARREAAALPDTSCSHGDFYRRNVLHAARGGVAVVDFEFVGVSPRFTDHLRLWSTLRQPADRRIVWDRLTAGAAPERRRHVAVLARWLVLRLLAENLSAPQAQRNAADLTHARAMVAEVGLLT